MPTLSLGLAPPLPDEFSAVWKQLSDESGFEDEPEHVMESNEHLSDTEQSADED